MKLAVRKLIIVAIFIFYMAIGHKAFIFLFGKAWWLDSAFDLVRFALYVFLVGCSEVLDGLWPADHPGTLTYEQ